MNAQDAIKCLEENFNETQIRIIKATINRGGWGSADFELNGRTINGYGYLTEDAKETIKDLTPRQIAGFYSGISKKIMANRFDFILHISDYWGEGNSSDGMLFIDINLRKDFENWAKSN